tara:strand:- start:235 stop:411 length:177 start_codon:yes stop_codon:yes gene_type:complete
MGHYEDAYYEIYNKVKQKGIREEFDNQLKKMERQDKHKYKSTKERWEYAYNRITSSLS